MEIFSSLLIGLLVLILISIFNANFSRNHKNLPPGPLRLPFLGNLLHVAWINSKEPHLAFCKLADMYGSIVSVQLGSVYSVVISSFELMEEYLHKPEFSDRYWNDWMSERTWQKRMGIVMAQYPHPWTQLRRFSVKSLKDHGLGKRSKMHPIIHAELNDVVGELKESLKKTNGIHTFDDYFTISALNVLWSMLAGTRYTHSDPRLIKLTKLSRQMFESVNLSNSFIFAFPEWRNWFPDYTGMSIQRKCFRETNAFFQEFIEERKNLGIYKTSPENLVDEFLQEIDSQQVEDEKVFTVQQLITVMSDFFLAGSETTSNTLAWCVLYLILNPDVQEKLQKEVDSLVPNGTFPELEHETELHYVRATLAETHRISSVLGLGVPRAATEDTQCGQYFIPKGTYVIVNLYGIHHDKLYWKDPETFRPERFLDENGKFKNDPRLKPFGFGKRACLGEPVATMSLIHYLTVLVQNFTFYPVPNEPLPSLSPVVGVTIGPKKFQALVKCRR